MKQYYEAHITMLGDTELIKKVVEFNKWKFSKIDGDIDLGDGVKCYATRHFNLKLGDDEVMKKLNLMACSLVPLPIKILRRKVERVIYDSRTDAERKSCDGNCVECKG